MKKLLIAVSIFLSTSLSAGNEGSGGSGIFLEVALNDIEVLKQAIVFDESVYSLDLQIEVIPLKADATTVTAVTLDNQKLVIFEAVGEE